MGRTYSSHVQKPIDHDHALLYTAFFLFRRASAASFRGSILPLICVVLGSCVGVDVLVECDAGVSGAWILTVEGCFSTVEVVLLSLRWFAAELDCFGVLSIDLGGILASMRKEVGSSSEDCSREELYWLRRDI